MHTTLADLAASGVSLFGQGSRLLKLREGARQVGDWTGAELLARSRGRIGWAIGA